MASPPLKRPPVFREDGTIEIRLTKGYVAIIDAVDAHLAQRNWHALVTESGNVYASSHRNVLLHRVIFGLGKGHYPEVDHLDGDGLNCRRNNMRVTTPGENKRNKGLRRDSVTGHVGVHCTGARFTATLGSKTLGRFDTLDEAVAARLAAERDEWGIQPRRAAAHQ